VSGGERWLEPLSKTERGFDSCSPSLAGKGLGVGADGSGYSCTGTLIAEDIVLTNAHCVVNPQTRKVSQAIAFQPNLVNGVVKSKNAVEMSRLDEWLQGN
jgi:hypothetical protein